MNGGKKLKSVLTVAGSDSSGGAGIQADLKTVSAHGLYGMSAVTALTAQNTTCVSGIFGVSPDFVRRQLDAVFTDIFPDAVKIGMLSEAGVIEAVAEGLEFYGAKNIVLDTVMVSTSGSRLLNPDACEALVKRLAPLAEVITPNIPEGEVLCGFEIKNRSDMERAALEIYKKCGASVLLKGGHSVSDASDLLCEKGNLTWYEGRKIDNPNTHGTGCTLSSAIACGLAKGLSLGESVRSAKSYISLALQWGLDMGKGSGPLHHGFNITDTDFNMM